MAINPIDYSLGVAPLNPAQQIMQGMAVGQSLLDAREQGLQRQQAAQLRPIEMQAAQLGLRQGLAAEADANAARAMQQAMAQSAAVRSARMQEAARALVTGQMTPDQVSRFAVEFPEHPINQKLKEVVEARTDVQRRQDFDRATQVAYALRSGNRDAAVSFLESGAQALEDAGAAEQAAGFRESVRQIRSGDAGANAVLGLTEASLAQLAPTLGKSLEEIQKAPANVRKAEADAAIEEANAAVAPDAARAAVELAKAQAARYGAQTQLEWARLKLDGKELAERIEARKAQAARDDVQLSEKQQAMLADSAVAAETQAAIARKAAGAAAAFEKADESAIERGMNTGAPAKLMEAVNVVKGSAGSMTEARLSYAQLVDDDIQRRAAESGNKLTDEDYKQQRLLYPPPTGAFAPIAKWLRTREADAKKKDKIETAKSAWLGQNGGLGPAREPFAIGDIVIERGQTFLDVAKAIGREDSASQRMRSFTKTDPVNIAPMPAPTPAPAKPAITPEEAAARRRRRPLQGV